VKVTRSPHLAAFGAVRQALIGATSADANVFPADRTKSRNAFSRESGSTPGLVGLKAPPLCGGTAISSSLQAKAGAPAKRRV
jgi:hypothetical protein